MLNENNIEAFIKEYSRSRVIIESTVRAILRRAEEYEQIFHKDFYSFTKDEALDMFKSASAISLTSLQNQKLTLAHASRFYLNRDGKPIDNIYDEIIKEDLIRCIDISKKKSKFITREQLTDIQYQLWNITDQAILEALWLGMGGKWYTELTYLIPEQVVKADMKIYFKNGKVIDIDDRVYHMLRNAFNETELLSYSEIAKTTTVQGKSLYKYRFNTIHTNSDSKDMVDAERRYRYLQRRLALMSEYLDIPLSARSINLSGLWHHMNIEMQKMGIEDFRQYLHTENARKLAARYDFKSKHYASILIQRFNDLI